MMWRIARGDRVSVCLVRPTVAEGSRRADRWKSWLRNAEGFFPLRPLSEDDEDYPEGPEKPEKIEVEL
jgi:hypothetical protein